MAAVTACDPQFMDAIDARGFAEAARENVMNETFMLKSDSVFEYSCFRLHADLATEQRSGTLSFEQGLASTATLRPIDGYLFNNFNHRYLSGRYQDPNPALPDPGPDMCNAMASVWESAKCMNFYDQPALDSFFELDYYISGEPRALPPEYAACAAQGYSKLSNALNIAFNGKVPVWTMSYLRDTTDYIDDPVNDLDEIYDHTDCGNRKIPTGMVVTDYNAPVDTFLEHVCPNPACVYVPTSYSAGECQLP